MLDYPSLVSTYMVGTLLYILGCFALDSWDWRVLAFVLGPWIAFLLVKRIRPQKKASRKTAKTAKKSRSKDEIPPDPTYEQIREVLGRAASYQKPGFVTQNQAPAQLTLWGTAEPITKAPARVPHTSSEMPPSLFEDPNWQQHYQ